MNKKIILENLQIALGMTKNLNYSLKYEKENVNHDLVVQTADIIETSIKKVIDELSIK